MPILKVKNNGEWNPLGISSHTHSISEITNFPSSLPANGGNADTVDGKHANEFALADDVFELKTLVGNTSVLEQITTATPTKLSQLENDSEYALRSELSPPLYVTLTLESGANTGSTSHTYTDILDAYSAGRDVMCIINGKIILPLTNIAASVAIFQGPNAGGTDRQVRFSPAWGNEAQVSDVEYASKSDLASYAKASDLGDYAKTTDLTPYVKTSDLDGYAKSTDLKPPLYVTMVPKEGNVWTTSHTYADIMATYDAGRDVICALNGKIVVPLTSINSSVAVFQGPTVNGPDRRVTFLSTWGNEAQVADVEYALKDDLNSCVTTEELNSYAKSEDLKPPLYVSDTGITTDTFPAIKAAYDGGRAVYCVAANSNGNGVIMPLSAITSESAAFQIVNHVDYTRVVIKADGTKVSSAGKYALQSDLDSMPSAEEVSF